MSRRGALLLLCLAIASLVLVTRREAAPPASAPGRGVPANRPEVLRDEKEVDPAAIRDVFRFVERSPAPGPPLDRRPAPQLTSPAPSPEPVRLVGLVRRQGRLLAAFAVDGDVVLAGPGERAGVVTVLEVGEEGVRIRRGDGSEELLALP